MSWVSTFELRNPANTSSDFIRLWRPRFIKSWKSATFFCFSENNLLQMYILVQQKSCYILGFIFNIYHHKLEENKYYSVLFTSYSWESFLTLMSYFLSDLYEVPDCFRQLPEVEVVAEEAYIFSCRLIRVQHPLAQSWSVTE